MSRRPQFQFQEGVSRPRLETRRVSEERRLDKTPSLTLRVSMYGKCALIAFALASIVFPTASVAHPISLSSVIIDVKPDKMVADLRILLEDLVLYHELKAGGDQRFAAADLQKAVGPHGDLLLKWFTVRDADGNLTPGKIAGQDVADIPAEGALQADLMKRSITYEIQFALKSPQDFLTFTQEIGGPRAVLPALMDCMVLQDGVLVDMSEQLLPAKPFTVKFDWKNPPVRPKNWKELRAKKEEEFRKRLGIASYAGLYSFVYITDQEVRHEILVPLLTLETWLKLPRKDAEFLEVDEQQAAGKSIEQFFRDRNPLRIDGVHVQPVLSRLNFFGLDINDFALNAKPRRVSIYQARVGIILSYSTKGTPDKVEMQWDMYNDYAPFLRSIIYTFDDDPTDHVFITDTQTYTWSNDGQRPDQAPVEAVTRKLATKLDEAEAQAVFGGLLKNVYRAFDYRDDGAIYDALAHSADGELLKTLYLQIKQSLLMAEQGGATSRVKEVKLVGGELTSSSPKQFQYQCRWQVAGSVEHWGHIHTRVNEYGATFTVAATAAGWKITRYEFNDQQRIRFETTLRAASTGQDKQP